MAKKLLFGLVIILCLFLNFVNATSVTENEITIISDKDTYYCLPQFDENDNCLIRAIINVTNERASSVNLDGLSTFTSSIVSLDYLNPAREHLPQEAIDKLPAELFLGGETKSYILEFYVNQSGKFNYTVDIFQLGTGNLLATTVLDPFYFAEIDIIGASHLDEDRVYLSDMYNDTYLKDDIWSETVYENEYVRMLFENNLYESRIIDLYARSPNGTNIWFELYEHDKNVTVGISNIISSQTGEWVFFVINDSVTDYIFDIKLFDDNASIISTVEFDYLHDDEYNSTCSNVYAYEKGSPVTSYCSEIATYEDVFLHNPSGLNVDNGNGNWTVEFQDNYSINIINSASVDVGWYVLASNSPCSADCNIDVYKNSTDTWHNIENNCSFTDSIKTYDLSSILTTTEDVNNLIVRGNTTDNTCIAMKLMVDYVQPSFDGEYCQQNWTPNYGSCLINDSMVKYYTDLNSCGLYDELPIDNGTYFSCNYCSETLNYLEGSCYLYNGTWIKDRLYSDSNYYSCCAITGIYSDCSIDFFPYNETQTINCTVLTQDFNLQLDSDVFFGFKLTKDNKVYGKIFINSTNETFECISYVETLLGDLIQTNPVYSPPTTSLISIFAKDIDNRETFQTKNGLANIYWSSENIVVDGRDYIFGVDCSGGHGSKLTSQRQVTVLYESVNSPITRLFWFKENIIPVALGLIFLLIIILMLGYLYMRFKQ